MIKTEGEFRELFSGITEKPRELRKERKLCVKWREVLHSSYTCMERWRLLEAGIDLMARKDSSHLGVELGGDLSQRGTKIRERERGT
jgi:hypothetical protein